MSSIPEEYVPTPAEVPADHWSKSPEWLAYKADMERMRNGSAYKADAEKLKGFMSVGTITPGTRKLTTHELQMESCKVAWVDPNPDETEMDKAVEAFKAAEPEVELTDTIIEDIATTIIKRLAAIDKSAHAVEEDAKAG